MIRRPPRSTLSSSSAASDVYKRQVVVLGRTCDRCGPRLPPLAADVGASKLRCCSAARRAGGVARPERGAATACQLLGERTEALVERDQRRAAENAALRECDQRHAAENAALRERNRLLSEEVAELRRRVDQNPRNSHRPPSSEGYAKPAPR